MEPLNKSKKTKQNKPSKKEVLRASKQKGKSLTK